MASLTAFTFAAYSSELLLLLAAILWYTCCKKHTGYVITEASFAGPLDATQASFVPPFRARQSVTNAANPPEHVPYVFPILSTSVMAQRARSFASFMTQRRSVRFFSEDPVPFGILQGAGMIRK